MRLDVALTTRGLARSRSQAAALVTDGRVRVDGVVRTKPSTRVASEQRIEADVEPWVSRAAHKLLGALDESGIAVPPRVLDAGASTGGFTQVCLSRDAERVYCVDVGHGQLAPTIAADPRTVVHEGLNLRDLTLAHLDDEPVGLVVGDVSFISLRLLLPTLLPVCTGTALLLVKPQFEVGRDGLGSGGIVRDPGRRRAAVDAVVEAAEALGWHEQWRGVSRLPGTHGNEEYFVALVPAPGATE
ncbi:TlyA family RNA methyltransferase [uncultured Tessaracoccus sp.]|uniref:TlyA family RNA methyltransferase n=1 Tax=uncultured Tessaracoccus sp. TaxID=905023 RepID=UPI0025FFAE6B|nr:TlyA family RNA methyltransferase [uncultured Tessaracoccus sp.]